MPRTYVARQSRFGGYLDDYEAGDTFEHWPGKTITEAEDHLFCLLTMAVSPLHVDAHFAETELDGGRNIVIGTFVYALVLGMSVPDVSGRAIANLGADELRHVAPVHHGDTLYAETTVLEVRRSRSRPAVGILTVETTGFNQHREVVCTFRRSVMIPVRPDANDGDASPWTR